MGTGRIAFLWHLHQPDYRDPTTGRPRMPWVRLHALRGVRDLLVDTCRMGVPWTLNFVPSLLDQLDDAARGVGDDHLATTRIPADSADPGAIRGLPCGHPAMTLAHPPFAALRARSDAGEPLTVGDLRDLQVWSTLAWFGASVRRDRQEVAALIEKGTGFTEADKAVLLDTQQDLLEELPALMAAAAQVPGATLSTSPYFHPILPLLCDARTAHRAMPDLPDDVRFAYPQDALQQLITARQRAEKAYGEAPIGLWPSEGAVSPEVVALAAEAGFRWLATDGQILARSDRTPSHAPPGGYDLGHGVVGFFRDTDLSDRIGFRYANAPVDRAVDDFCSVARERAGQGTLLVALDGENPWESYADAGGAFRERLVAELRRRGPALIGLDDAAAMPTVGRVHRLHTGSWIGANLAIWAGHPEDRAAWRLVAEAREAAETVALTAPELARHARTHLYAAEGSDWFWWFGEEFETPFIGLFDGLFRAHLRAAWEALGLSPPASLLVPVHQGRGPDRTDPQRFLPIDPRAPDGFAGWLGCGEIRPRRGAMADQTGVQRLCFGWSEAEPGQAGALWVRLECGPDVALSPAPDQSFPTPFGLVARYDSGTVALQAGSPGGDLWPGVPLDLHPPGKPGLLWWEV